MHILLTASEVNPFVKVGGLADVAGALPRALENLNHKVSIVMPGYRTINLKNKEKTRFIEKLDIPLGYGQETASVDRVKLSENISLYLINNGAYFSREKIYDYPDDSRRFIFFSRASYELARILEPDIIHCNDWHTALIPGYVKFSWDKKRVGTIFSIHNIAYQGICDRDMFFYSKLPESSFNSEEVEYYGKFNIMKSGIVYSDMINTVSPTYAQEIKTPEFGYGLDGLLRKRQDVLVGILNGIDEIEYDPSIDRYIPVRYSVDTIEKKEDLKRFLLEKLGLQYRENTPVFSFIGRLWEQKGIDILSQAIPGFIERELYLVILGTGSDYYHHILTQIAQSYKEKISLNLKFDNELAHLIYGGSDFFMMPSKFEPCGLGQMIAMRYGTIPIVRSVGGLKDTVKDGETGFTFIENTPQAIINTVKKALNLYQNDKENLTMFRKIIMREDHSWNKSAKEYEKIYLKILEEK